MTRLSVFWERAGSVDVARRREREVAMLRLVGNIVVGTEKF